MTVEKRPAFESPAALAERETAPPAMKRPMATAIGALLVVARVCAGVIWLVALVVQWDDVLRSSLDPSELDLLDPATSAAVLGVVIGVGVLVLLIDLTFGVLVYFGNNVARLAVMIFATLSITAAAIEYFAGDQDITIRTTLVTVSLDILVLLALSSRAARAYARRPRPRPRPRRERTP